MKYRYQGLLGFAASVTLMALILTGCAIDPAKSAEAAQTAVSPVATEQDSTAQKKITAAELAKYDGKNGNPAYIAVNGVVYDVTNVPEWKSGKHNGRFQAGKDYTEEIKKSPHGTVKLDGVPIAGTYTK